MVKILSLVLMVFCVLYVNALPPGSRVRRGFNNSGHGSDRGGGYFGHGSNDRDASSGHGREEDCNSEKTYDSEESRETTYGGDNYNQNNQHYGGRRPR